MENNNTPKHSSAEVYKDGPLPQSTMNIPNIYNIDDIKEVYSQKDWCIDGSKNVETMLNGAENIKDNDYLKKFLNSAQKAFEKKYGLASCTGTLKVLMIGADFGGCGYVRIDNPSKYLNRESDIVVFPTIKVCIELATWADIIVWQRQYKAQFIKLVETCKKLGKVQIFDLDDNLHALDESNPVYETFKEGSVAYNDMIKFSRSCDVMTTTKEELGEFYKKFIGLKNYSILPNCIDFEDMPKTTPKVNKTGVIRIGWAGSTTHYDDLKEASYGLNRIKEKYGDKVEIVMMGFDGKMRKWKKIDENLEATQNNLRLDIVGDSLDGVKREFHKFSKIGDFHKSLVELDLDIAIIPLKRTRFNDTGKSNLKFLEFAAINVPCVASKTPVYSDVIHGETGLVCKRDADFEKHIDALINSQELRHKIAKNAYKYVKENYDMSIRVSDWANLYRKLFWESMAKKQNNA
jgi:glycosyltransferase involved in cell wall biosynthesis